MELVELVKQFGPLLAAVIFFIWRDWQREERMSKRIENLEAAHSEVIIPLVHKTSEVIATSTIVMERNTTVMERNVQVMDRINSALKTLTQCSHLEFDRGSDSFRCSDANCDPPPK
jgi:hypothetical protein